MVTDSEIYSLIDELGIELIYEKLPSSINGVYYEDGEYPIIVINNNISSSSRLLRCVICEELGHYFTCVGNIAGGQLKRGASNISYNKYENKALKWATNYLINTNRLLKLISDNPDTKEIADHFNVTQSFLIDKFYFMSLESIKWDLHNGKFLYLSNLPSIFIAWDFKK
jgi:Zn-dependent peptidase ImmA (M78 family)